MQRLGDTKEPLVRFHRYPRRPVHPDIRTRALDKLDAPERARIESRLAAHESAARPAAAEPAGPPRSFVKNWTLADLEPYLDGPRAPRDPVRGREVFHSMLCARCHQSGKDGQGGAGPDLTGLAARFSRRDILEATLSE